MKFLPLIALFLLSCADPIEQRVRVTKDDLLKGVRVNAPVRIHTFGGSVYLAQTGFTLRNDTIICTGQKYAPARWLEGDGTWRISADSVVGIEYVAVTTPPLRSLGNFISATTATLYTAFGTLIILKAIFGSCPTFYTFDNQKPVLEAEGFSYSIGKYFEDGDLDRLHIDTPPDGILRIAVRNEALETHYINQIGLRYLDHPEGTQAYPSPEPDLVHILRPRPPHSALSRSGRNVLEAVAGRDGIVYESDDLTTRELLPRNGWDYIECELENPTGSADVTIVLRGRNTLQNTVLLYDVMMRNQGPLVTEWVRKVNENPFYSWRLYEWYKDHSGIRIYVENDGRFEAAGRIPDTGPIAWKETAVRIPVDPENHTVRLRFAFLPESWAIDWVGYDEQGYESETITHLGAASSVNNREIDDGGIMQSVKDDDDEYLTTFPGTEVTLSFRVPPQSDRARTCFVWSKGYYIEWIRGEWLKARDDIIVFDISNPGKISQDLAALWHQKRAGITEEFYAHKIPLAR